MASADLKITLDIDQVLLTKAMRVALADAWDAALDHVWELNDPANTIVPTTSKLALLTEQDVWQAQKDNPFREPVSMHEGTGDGTD